MPLRTQNEAFAVRKCVSESPLARATIGSTSSCIYSPPLWMIPEENLNLPVFRNCTWSWHHLNREVGAATPWIRGPLAHAVRDAHFAHLPPVPILGAVHARDLDLGSGKLLPTAAWPKGNMGAARGLHPRDVTGSSTSVTGLSNPCATFEQ